MTLRVVGVTTRGARAPALR